MLDPNRLAEYLEISDPSSVIYALSGYIRNAESIVHNWTGFVFGKQVKEYNFIEQRFGRFVFDWPVWELVSPTDGSVTLDPDNDPAHPKRSAFLRFDTDTRPLVVQLRVGDDVVPDELDSVTYRIAAGLYRRDFDPEARDFNPMSELEFIPRRSW